MKYTAKPTYLGGDGNADLIFCGEQAIAYFGMGKHGMTLHILQGMNRELFRSKLLDDLPIFCSANKITEKTHLDIWTRRELNRREVICRVNERSRLLLESRDRT
jgi:hypothetical protein